MTALRPSQALSLSALPAGARSAAGLLLAAGIAIAAFTSGLSAVTELTGAGSLQPVTMAGSLTPERSADYISAGARVAPLRHPAR